MSQPPPFQPRSPLPPTPTPPSSGFWTKGKIIGISVGAGVFLLALIVLIVVIATSGSSRQAGDPGPATRSPEVVAYVAAVNEVCKEGRSLIKAANAAKSRAAYSVHLDKFAEVMRRVPSPPAKWDDVQRMVKALGRTFEEMEADMARLERETIGSIRSSTLRRLESMADNQQAAIERIEREVR